MPSCGSLAFTTQLPDIPDKVKQGLLEGPSYVGFEKSSADNSGAVYYKQVCSQGGEVGLVDFKGNFYATLGGDKNSCISVGDMTCYNVSDCLCMSQDMKSNCSLSNHEKSKHGIKYGGWQNECQSNLSRIILPPGVGYKVYGNWNCSGNDMGIGHANFTTTEQTYATTSDQGKQSLSFDILPGYKCNSSGHVELTDPSAAKAAQSAQSVSYHKKIVILAAGGVLVLLLLAMYVGSHKTSLDTPDLTNKQILSQVGLAKGAPLKGRVVKGSIRAILGGQDVKHIKGA